MKRTYLTLVLMLLLLAPSLACTTFLISGKYTPDGKPLLFKNRDTGQLQNSLAFFNDGKYKYIGLVNGDADWDKMVWGGYNESGFAIMNSAAYNNNIGDTTKLIDQEGVLMKLVLQNCQTLRDFENLLDTLQKPMGVDANFGVIDAFGGAAFYETGNFDYKKYDANDEALAPHGILVRTNHSMRGDLTKGYGFCRYQTAFEALEKAADAHQLLPQYLFNSVSRNLYHSLTQTDLMADLPNRGDEPEFKFFLDYIPRRSTASAILIVGAKDEQHMNDAMMWTILGFPLTSVAVPVWVCAGDDLPEVVSMNDSLQSPLCKAALQMKADCFPLTYDKGYNYINLSAVVNQQNTGYMQVLRPIENELFVRANRLMDELEEGRKSEKDIRQFYRWVDNYLEERYRQKLGIDLQKL